MLIDWMAGILAKFSVASGVGAAWRVVTAAVVAIASATFARLRAFIRHHVLEWRENTCMVRCKSIKMNG